MTGPEEEVGGEFEATMPSVAGIGRHPYRLAIVLAMVIPSRKGQLTYFLRFRSTRLSSPLFPENLCGLFSFLHITPSIYDGVAFYGQLYTYHTYQSSYAL